MMPPVRPESVPMHRFMPSSTCGGGWWETMTSDFNGHNKKCNRSSELVYWGSSHPQCYHPVTPLSKMTGFMIVRVGFAHPPSFHTPTRETQITTRFMSECPLARLAKPTYLLTLLWPRVRHCSAWWTCTFDVET